MRKMKAGDFYTVNCHGLTIVGVVVEEEDDDGTIRGWEIHLGYKHRFYSLTDATRNTRSENLEFRPVRLRKAVEDWVELKQHERVAEAVDEHNAALLGVGPSGGPMAATVDRVLNEGEEFSDGSPVRIYEQEG